MTYLHPMHKQPETILHSKDKLQKRKNFWARHRRWWYALGVLILIVLLMDLFGSIILIHFVNKKLANLGEYQGHVKAIHFHVWKGGATVRDLVIEKKTGNIPVPFVSIYKVDAGLAWKYLFHGAIVAVIEVWNPKINFVDNPNKAQTQTGVGVPWTQTVKSLMPISINDLIVHNGEVHLRNFQSSAPDSQVNIVLDKVNLEVKGLTNRPPRSGILNTSAHMTALAMGRAPLKVVMHMNAFAEEPTFNLSMQLLDLPLIDMNPALRLYAKFDVLSGTLSAASDMAVHEGVLSGYFKPVLKDLKITSIKKMEKKGFSPWEAFLSLVKDLFKNQPKNQVGTRIPLSGTISKQNVNIIATVGMVFYNAFIKALTPNIEENVGAKKTQKK